MPNTFRLLALTLAGALGTAGSASAAWDNVFQVCCHDCGGGQTRSSYSAPQACPQACPQPCAPQPEMRISYVQRCYYQPVTEYVQKSYYEPVKKNVTSYYYEPVTEYKYSTYYDPCTGCPQKVCTPTTAYKLRSQCNSVTSYVMRTCTVPVTSLKPVTYQQPVVSYYYPPTPSAAAAAPAPAYIPPAGGPSVDELRSNQPSVQPGGSSDMIVPQQLPTSPQSYPKPNTNVRLRPEKTVSRSSVVTVRGEVTMPDQMTPRANAKLVFMNADKPEQKEYVNANAYGEFDVQLPAGKWFMYVGGEGGKATYHKQLALGERDTYDYKVVSR
jgi:hypothetical protein